MKTRKELKKSLATAKALVTRYENSIAKLDAKRAARTKDAATNLTDADKAPLHICDYSEKTYVVYGGTKSRLETFRALREKNLCKFSKGLRINDKGVRDGNAKPISGWIFFKSKTATKESVMELLK